MTAKKEVAQLQKTHLVKKEGTQHGWLILDAKGKTLGRLAAEISKILRGKHRPTYTPGVDMGDGVIIINAEHVKVTGNKEAQKMYYTHTGFLGGLRETNLRTMRARKPDMIIELAVKGMMPKSRLAKSQMKRLRVFAGDQHAMEAQKPIHVNI